MTKEEIWDILIWGDNYANQSNGIGKTKFQLFSEIRSSLKGELYWFALLEVHIHSDNTFPIRSQIKEAFNSKEPDRHTLMDESEQKYLETLPDKITIYRGMTKEELMSGDFGICWTLSKERAEWFAKEYPRNFDTNHLEKAVHELVINKSDVVAFLNRRKEQEIIYLHKPTKTKKD